MKIDLRPLRAERGGTLVVDVHESVSSGLDEVPFLAHVDGSLTLVNLGSAVRVEGRVATVVGLTCDRCARAFRHDARAVIHEDLDWTAPGDGFLVVAGDTVVLDVDGLVREALMLELPMVTLCQPDCKGLCDQCGADLRVEPCRCARTVSDAGEQVPVDPRLGRLAAWRKSDDAGRR